MLLHAEKEVVVRKKKTRMSGEWTKSFSRNFLICLYLTLNRSDPKRRLKIKSLFVGVQSKVSQDDLQR